MSRAAQLCNMHIMQGPEQGPLTQCGPITEKSKERSIKNKYNKNAYHALMINIVEILSYSGFSGKSALFINLLNNIAFDGDGTTH